MESVIRDCLNQIQSGPAPHRVSRKGHRDEVGPYRKNGRAVYSKKTATIDYLP